MPNWCFNNLLLYSNNEDTLENIRKAFCEDKLLDYLLPMPEGLKNQGIDSLSKEEREALEQKNIEQYGSRDWYYWANKNWGTKWDVGAEDSKAYENHNYLGSSLTDRIRYPALRNTAERHVCGHQQSRRSTRQVRLLARNWNSAGPW